MRRSPDPERGPEPPCTVTPTTEGATASSIAVQFTCPAPPASASDTDDASGSTERTTVVCFVHHPVAAPMPVAAKATAHNRPPPPAAAAPTDRRPALPGGRREAASEGWRHNRSSGGSHGRRGPSSPPGSPTPGSGSGTAGSASTSFEPKAVAGRSGVGIGPVCHLALGRMPGLDERAWVRLTGEALSLDAAARWVRTDSCGAVVLFGGTVRDHAEGRPGVVELEYEAYTEQVEPRLRRIAGQALERWAGAGRVVLWHRTGVLAVGEYSVLVAVSAAHRGDAFDAARFCIDAVKASVPIWKREKWSGGDGWGLDAQDIAEVSR